MKNKISTGAVSCIKEISMLKMIYGGVVVRKGIKPLDVKDKNIWLNMKL